jgi:hypothetical protein
MVLSRGRGATYHLGGQIFILVSLRRAITFDQVSLILLGGDQPQSVLHPRFILFFFFPVVPSFSSVLKLEFRLDNHGRLVIGTL